ncbi:MAG: ATPase, T2SS/T4P/T4SS family, partial [Alphaproteobacteria bacterium]
MNIVRIEPGSKTGAPVQRPGGDLTTSADAAARSGLTAAGLLEAVADGDTADLARQVGDAIDDGLKQAGVKLSTIQRRQLAGRWLTTLRQQSRDARRAVQDSARAAALAPTTGLKTGPVMHDITVGNSETPEDPSHAFLTDTPSESVATSPEEDRATRNRDAIDQAKRQIQPVLINRIDVGTALTLDRTELRSQIHEVVGELLVERRIQLNKAEQGQLVASLMNDLLGLGPLEPLLADDSITDIMVNGPAQIYVERAGKLVLTDVRFENNVHVMNVATRIVTAIGRRIDESSPMVDARLADGSRVNIIIPPLAIDGPSISIRK